jgi:hypothetical protein
MIRTRLVQEGRLEEHASPGWGVSPEHPGPAELSITRVEPVRLGQLWSPYLSELATEPVLHHVGPRLTPGS